MRITTGKVTLGDNYPRYLECWGDTKDGDIIITLPSQTGKYIINIQPMEDKYEEEA